MLTSATKTTKEIEPALPAIETVDVVVVGGRCSGSAAAITLHKAGHNVVMLERGSFPSDTLSTHLLWPSTLAEYKKLGALERILQIDAPQMPVAFAAAHGHQVRTGYRAVDGIDYALCIRRKPLDAALAQTAREAGIDLRERCAVTDLIWQNGRVVGVKYNDVDKAQRQIRASLVIGADGRNSTVARLVGASEPFYTRPSGRACFFAYWQDNQPSERYIASQWREGSELGTMFPCDDGLALSLLQTPVERVPEFKADLEGEYLRTIQSIPGLRDRLDGCQLASKVRMATGIEQYFRRSTGPGWALPGDAGHFKDPCTAQGIRDALHYGRRLGEHISNQINDSSQLDSALTEWERERFNDCLEILQWSGTIAEGKPVRPLEKLFYSAAANDSTTAHVMTDLFSRIIRPASAYSAKRIPALLSALRGTSIRSKFLLAVDVVRTMVATRRDRKERARLQR